MVNWKQKRGSKWIEQFNTSLAEGGKGETGGKNGRAKVIGKEGRKVRMRTSENILEVQLEYVVTD